MKPRGEPKSGKSDSAVTIIRSKKLGEFLPWGSADGSRATLENDRSCHADRAWSLGKLLVDCDCRRNGDSTKASGVLEEDGA